MRGPDNAVDLGTYHVSGQPHRVEADLAGHRPQRRLVQRPAARHQGFMERRVFPLPRRSDGSPRGPHRIRPQDREFLAHQPHPAIGRQQPLDLARRLAAIGAAVIEKLHHGHITGRVPRHRQRPTVEQPVPVPTDEIALAMGLACLVAPLQHGNRLHDDVGMGHQVSPHPAIESPDIGGGAYRQGQGGKNYRARKHGPQDDNQSEKPR